MGIIKSAAGTVRIRITSADLSGALTAILNNNISIFDVSHSGDLSADISLHRKDFTALNRLLSRRGEKVEILQEKGLYRIFNNILRRPVLCTFVLILLLLTLFLPSRILFIKVSGNSDVPTNYILEQAQECGIVFWASRREVRSESVKNRLLEEIPQLSWVGINTSGFVATIEVREREITDTEIEKPGISSIVALRDGIIQDITVTQGVGMCRVGQAVKAGQVLISGYEDLGILIRATRAQGEIIAQTKRDIQAVSLVSTLNRGEETHRQVKYSLIIGKKQIKLYKDSGISDTSCVKIYDKVDITLPGDNPLPVSLVREQWIYYNQDVVATSENSFDWMRSFSQEYMKSQMLAGTIHNEEISLQLVEDICVLQGNYACTEMIGHVRDEEIIQYYGENS